MSRTWWGRPESQPAEEFTIGRRAFHVCGVCGAVTLGDDDSQMFHAAWHVAQDSLPESRA